MGASSWVHLQVELIKRETDAALLCVIGGEEVWIPKSQVADPDDYEAGDADCTVSVTEWLARQKGLEGAEG